MRKLVGLLALAVPVLAFAQGDSSAQLIRVTGRVASISTTRPVVQADIRLFFVDSAHGTGRDAVGIGEIFVDSSRSRVGVTDASGAFSIFNITPGHYFMQVRRLGFSPIEAMVNVASLPVDMELAMTQVDAVLSEVRINASAINRVTTQLDRIGFTQRRKTSSSGTFVSRTQILDRHSQRITDFLAGYGFGDSTFVMIDGIESDWMTLRDYPVDLVIGMELYRRRGALPAEYDRTRRGSLSFGPGGSGGRDQGTVLVWTFIP